MRTEKLNSFVMNILAGTIMVGVLPLFSSCATKTKFLTSSISPAVQGYAKVGRDNDQNYVIQIHILNLPEIENPQNSNQTYVVWMETNKGTNKNLGQLISSPKFSSKQLKASLKAVSPYKPIRIFITIEDRAYVQKPNSKIMISTGRF